MAKKQSIIEQLYNQDFINDEPDIVRGIAQAAIDRGYDNLSDKQKNIIKHLFQQKCQGVADPSGFVNNCQSTLTEEELDNALNLAFSYSGLLCRSCIDEAEGYRRHWDKLSKQ